MMSTVLSGDQKRVQQIQIHDDSAEDNEENSLVPVKRQSEISPLWLPPSQHGAPLMYPPGAMAMPAHPHPMTMPPFVGGMPPGMYPQSGAVSGNNAATFRNGKMVITSQKFLCTYKIGIKESDSFGVSRRIIGPNGHNMKLMSNIVQGAKIRLRGEGFQDSLPDVPLQANLSVPTKEGYVILKYLMEKLLTKIYDEFAAHGGRRINLQLQEHPLNPHTEPGWEQDYKRGNPIFSTVPEFKTGSLNERIMDRREPQGASRMVKAGVPNMREESETWQGYSAGWWMHTPYSYGKGAYGAAYPVGYPPYPQWPAYAGAEKGKGDAAKVDMARGKGDYAYTYYPGYPEHYAYPPAYYPSYYPDHGGAYGDSSYQYAEYPRDGTLQKKRTSSTADAKEENTIRDRKEQEMNPMITARGDVPPLAVADAAQSSKQNSRDSVAHGEGGGRGGLLQRDETEGADSQWQ